MVISASHNPFQDNGIKFFSDQGTKLPDSVELEIEAALDEPMACVASEKLGRAKRLDDAQGRYIEFCKSTFPNELDLRGLKLVVDCAQLVEHVRCDVVGGAMGAIDHQLQAAPSAWTMPRAATSNSARAPSRTSWTCAA